MEVNHEGRTPCPNILVGEKGEPQSQMTHWATVKGTRACPLSRNTFLIMAMGAGGLHELEVLSFFVMVIALFTSYLKDGCEECLFL